MKMAKPNPRLQLETLFVIDARRRIVSTREPHPSPGPTFVFIRGESACAWAVRTDVPEPAARELDRLASEEAPSAAWDRPLRRAVSRRLDRQGRQERQGTQCNAVPRGTICGAAAGG